MGEDTEPKIKEALPPVSVREFNDQCGIRKIAFDRGATFVLCVDASSQTHKLEKALELAGELPQAETIRLWLSGQTTERLSD